MRKYRSTMGVKEETLEYVKSIHAGKEERKMRRTDGERRE